MTTTNSGQTNTNSTAEVHSNTSSPNSCEALDAQRRQIRQTLHRKRQSLTAATVSSHSQRIAQRVAPLLKDARHIAGYLAIGNEVNVETVLADCRRQQGHSYVPLIQADHSLLFAPLHEDSVIVQNKYGIREPEYSPQSCVDVAVLDAVLVPLLGFDQRCNRMGMGGGYYDRTFAHRRQSAPGTASPRKPLLIGVAHELQCANSVLPAWWDVPLDWVITESQLYHRPIDAAPER